MASRKVNLAEALAKKSEPAPESEAVQVAPITGRPVSSRAPGREGKANISGWFDMSVKFTLDELRLKRQRELGRTVTVQELLGEAYNDLFKKYGFPEVAPVKAQD